MSDTERGLYQKYFVSRTDGKSDPGEKHDGCEYFVLDLTHDPFAAAAIRAYAEKCQFTHTKLAHELRMKAMEMEAHSGTKR